MIIQTLQSGGDVLRIEEDYSIYSFLSFFDTPLFLFESRRKTFLYSLLMDGFFPSINPTNQNYCLLLEYCTLKAFGENVALNPVIKVLHKSLENKININNCFANGGDYEE